ncbi:MAG: DUF1254 domain-containing protein [Rhodomicrobium sp.]
MGSLPWILGGTVAAGIIHILCVFSIPLLAERDAWARLSAAMKPNALVVADGKNVPRLPFTPPDVLTAYCLFDLSSNNVIVKSPLPEGPWSLTVSTRSGENFYVVTGADAKKPEVRLLIIPHDRLPEEASTEKTEQGDDQNIIVSPSQTGIVAIRAPLRGESFRGLALDELRKARCEIQKPLVPLVASVEPLTAEPSGENEQPAPRRPRRQKRR